MLQGEANETEVAGQHGGQSGSKGAGAVQTIGNKAKIPSRARPPAARPGVPRVPSAGRVPNPAQVK